MINVDIQFNIIRVGTLCDIHNKTLTKIQRVTSVD